MILFLVEERKKIFSWLFPSAMPQNNYDSALEKCLEDTTSWILKEGFFMKWKQSGGSVLQLIGKRELWLYIF